MSGRSAPVRRLTTLDMLNLSVETTDTPMHVAVLAVLDGRPLCDAHGRLRLAEIRNEIGRRFTDVPQLRGLVHHPRPPGGRPVWVDDPDFRVERHVADVRLPARADTDTLLRLAEDLLTAPLPRTRPLWRIWFLTGLPDRRMAALVCLHHVIADGPSAIALVSSLLRAPLPENPPAPTRRPVPPPSWWELVRDNVATRLSATARWLSRPPLGRVRTLPARWRVLARCYGAPRTSLNVPAGPRRRSAVLRMDLAETRRVAHAHGGKINDVVLCLAAGGLRELLCHRGERTDGPWLRASVALSLRTPGADAAVGNRTGGIVVRLPQNEPDPAERLRMICVESRRAKADQLPTTGNAVLVWLARAGLLQRFTRRQRLTNLVESNVAGPRAPISLLGAPVADLVPVGNLAGNLAVSFLALSYTGHLNLAVRADADAFPDLPVVLAAMKREWALLTQGETACAASEPIA